MKNVNWIVVGVIGCILLLFLFGGGMLMSNWGYGGWGMMGRPSGMMGNWGYSPFGWIGVLIIGLVSIGFITLIVLGIVWLVRKLGNSHT